MGLLDLVLPSRCAGCGAPSEACCLRCTREFTGPHPLPVTLPSGTPAYAMAGYRGPARQVVLAFKERRRRDLAKPLGRVLASGVLNLCVPRQEPVGEAERIHRNTAATGSAPGDRSQGGAAVKESGARARVAPAEICSSSAGPPRNTSPSARPPRNTIYLVPVPSKRTAARRRGGPPMQLLAEECAAVMASRGVATAVAPALRLAAGVQDAVGLGAVARAANLAGRIHLVPAGRPPPGAEVVVLDDVLTTGTTATEVVRVLTKAGLSVAVVLTLTSVQAFRWVR